jgi:endonuclease-8
VLEAAEGRGKHLLLRFSGGIVLHSHLGMRGSWHIQEAGQRWRRPSRRAWIAIASRDHEAVNFDGSTLRLVREIELGRDPRLARLGPDILAPGFDLEGAAALVAARGGDLELGEALLDQTLVSGIGNIFKSEGCFAAGASPWLRVAGLDRPQLSRVLAGTRALMSEALASGRPPSCVYRRAGRPCPRCGTEIRSRAQGDEARITYWCPRCQEAGSERIGERDGAAGVKGR